MGLSQKNATTGRAWGGELQSRLYMFSIVIQKEEANHIRGKLPVHMALLHAGLD
jgi:hypothetical protein